MSRAEYTAGPTFRLNRLGAVDTYEVMEPDLQALETATRREELLLVFVSSSVGIFVPSTVTFATMLATLPSAMTLGYSVAVLMAGVVALSTLGTSAVGIAFWRIESRERPSVMKRIRSSYRVVP